jgi:hypothetical protein
MQRTAHLLVLMTYMKEADKIVWCEASVSVYCEEKAVMAKDGARETLQLCLVIFTDRVGPSQKLLNIRNNRG